MTERLYQLDSYLKEFNSQILHHNEKEKTIELDKTAFYPGGGGQPCDTGWLIFPSKKIKIWKVSIKKHKIWHFYKGIINNEVKNVKGELDWSRRYDIMRTHTAMHILSAIAWRDYGVQVTGGNMEVLQGRLDFEFESLSPELVNELEFKANQEVKFARMVKVDILPRKRAMQIPDLIRTKINLLPKELKKIRTVEIEGLDLQADGGTHVHNTKEVGKIKITDYKSKGKMNKRIKFTLVRETK
ncbi:MAG: alanyl-tRNA editing protein [Candidatus Cloacimonadota bacterium]|nr:alanyl-tRNA editing protein [Candidatus Cloacimonadota bacterium]